MSLPYRILFLFLVVTLQGAYAQDNVVPSDSTAKFSAQTELVMVPVVVTDHSGAHLRALKKEDFSLLEDGKEQKIAFFEEMVTTPRPARRVTHPNEFSNTLEGSSNTRRLTVIVLDTINTPFLDQGLARKALVKFLDETLDSGEPTALFSVSRTGLKVIHDFSAEPKVLAAALRKVRQGEKPLADKPSEETLTQQDSDEVSQLANRLMEFQRASENQMNAFQQRVAIVTTLEAMQHIAQALGGLPGRKALIWATGGFPFSITDDMRPSLDPSTPFARRNPASDSLHDVLSLYEHTWQSLNQAQISVYPIDVRGLVGFSDASVRSQGRDFYSRASWNHQETIATFQTFAAMTGGKAFYNSNDLNHGFVDASLDNSQYYTLGYYLDKSSRKEGWHKLSVKVRHDQARVRARNGFFLTRATADPVATARQDLTMAVNSPIDYTAISIAASWNATIAAKDPGKKRATFSLIMPPNFAAVDETDRNHLVVEIVAVAKDETGKPAGEVSQKYDLHLKPESLQQIRGSGFTYRGAIDVAPGEYTVRFAVRDDLSGRVGSVAAPLKLTP
jgi:VWFA-related protein